MDLTVYSLAHLQNLEQMLNHFEGEGVTDSRFIRQRIHDFLHAEGIDRKRGFLEITTPAMRKKYRRPTPAAAAASFPTITCPHCNTPLVPVANPDGLRIIGCKRCRYSRILEGTDG